VNKRGLPKLARSHAFLQAYSNFARAKLKVTSAGKAPEDLLFKIDFHLDRLFKRGYEAWLLRTRS